MRVALFVPTLHYGGVERVMLHLAQGLVDAGNQVEIVAANSEGEFRERVPKYIPVIDLGAKRVISSFPALLRYLRSRKPDALIAAMAHCNAVALLARKLGRTATRIIATEHSSLTEITGASRRARVRVMPWIARRLYPSADEIVAVSQGVADDLKLHLRSRVDRIRVIYNPVITPELLELGNAPLDDEWFRPGQPPVILGVGRLEPEKDFVTLLRAFALVRNRRTARLLILGEGSQRPAIEAAAEQLGIESDVRLPGFCSNPYPFMRRSALLALTSRWEAFGLVLVEALALGTPVVSTDCPSGPREVLSDGRLGTLVPVGDVSALADALEKALAARREPASADSLRAFTIENAIRQYGPLIQPN